jgi:alpha-beta hydrolase superfamily lysophospholipase
MIDRRHRAGIHNTAAGFYPGGRHEMLNETNRAEVREHLLAWIAATLQRSPQSSH